MKLNVSAVVLSVVLCPLAYAAAPETSEDAPTDPLTQGTQQLQHAEARLKEAQALVAEGNPTAAAAKIKDYDTAITGATEALNHAADQGQDVSQAWQAVDRATQKHTEVLTGLLDKVPDQAKPAIQHALDVSQRGRTHALNALANIRKQRESSGGPPQGVGRPEGLGRPEGVGQPEGMGRPAWGNGGPTGAGRALDGGPGRGRR